MKWHAPHIESSQVSEIGYDTASKTLGIRFKGGTEYHYHSVGHDTYGALCESKSVGQFLHTHIKPHHKFTKTEKENT